MVSLLKAKNPRSLFSSAFPPHFGFREGFALIGKNVDKYSLSDAVKSSSAGRIS